MDNSACPFDSLPNELLLHIFCYLPCHEILKSSLVCRRWKDFITSHRHLLTKPKRFLCLHQDSDESITLTVFSEEEELEMICFCISFTLISPEFGTYTSMEELDRVMLTMDDEYREGPINVNVRSIESLLQFVNDILLRLRRHCETVFYMEGGDNAGRPLELLIRSSIPE